MLFQSTAVRQEDRAGAAVDTPRRVEAGEARKLQVTLKPHGGGGKRSTRGSVAV